jgi:hypothetical protein
MKSALLTLALCLAVALTAGAQTFHLNVDQTPKAWQLCDNPGGSGSPSTQTITQTKNGLEFALTGPAYTDALYCDKTGATDAQYFVGDYEVTIPTLSGVQALEYDMFAFNIPFQYMFGSECVIGAKWQVWDMLHFHWINTTLPCELTAGTHHIQWWVHRVNGQTASCDGMPCMYFDVLGVDGVYTTFNLAEPAGWVPANWTNNAGIQFQLDLSDVSAQTTITETVRSVNLVQTP